MRIDMFDLAQGEKVDQQIILGQPRHMQMTTRAHGSVAR